MAKSIMTVIIAPSILSADFGRLNEELAALQSFGASAPADKLYTQFNLTPQAIVKEVQTRCKLNT